jgi:hypothetical protein
VNHYIYKTDGEGVQRYVLSLLPAEAGLKNSSGNTAIVGFLTTEKLDFNNFTENKAFKERVQQLMAEHLPTHPDFLNEGKRVGTGYAYVLDKRTKKPRGDVPFRDVIGAMDFNEGILIPDSYTPNVNYKLFTQDGLFQLPYGIEEKLAAEFRM